MLVAAVVALLVASPAMAQDAAPVVGAGSFTSAPILEPGTYRDTVLPEEYLYYGVRVGAGQRLRVTLEAGLDPRELADLGLAYVQVNLHGPDPRDAVRALRPREHRGQRRGAGAYRHRPGGHDRAGAHLDLQAAGKGPASTSSRSTPCSSAPGS